MKQDWSEVKAEMAGGALSQQQKYLHADFDRIQRESKKNN